tara:strand:+ start:952 stop:1446 length:495 start_codon:yes stop_codon:yes gene_type:complete
MKFEDFMKAEEFKDFHDYFHCSRNNKYKFSKNKFETTLEYYQHLYKIEKVDVEECLRIFNEKDIKIIPRERMKFYYVNDIEQHYNDKNTNTTNITYYVEEIEEDTIKESKHILRKIEGNIPIMFRKNTKYNHIDDYIDNDNEILYDILSGEENDSDSEESEELI